MNIQNSLKKRIAAPPSILDVGGAFLRWGILLLCHGRAQDQGISYQGMTLHHRQMLALQPDYLRLVKKLNTHQASPMLTNTFLDTLIKEYGIDRDKVASM